MGLTAGCKAVKPWPVNKNLVVHVLKFDNVIGNTSILVINGLLAMITYCSNPVLLQIFAANNTVKVVNFVGFQESHEIKFKFLKRS